MICAGQTREGTDTANKDKNMAILDNLDLRKYCVETDGQRYPRDSVFTNHEKNDFIEQYKNLKKLSQTFWKTNNKSIYLIPRHGSKRPYQDNRLKTSS